MKKRYWPRPTSIHISLERFLQRINKPNQRQIIELWRHWHVVMGNDIANLAWPLGQKDDVLMLGGEDALSLQEISFMHFEILERANAFMGCEYFSTIKVSLSLDKTPLDIACQEPPSPKAVPPVYQALHGKFLKDMPPEHPVAQCYARYVAKSQTGR